MSDTNTPKRGRGRPKKTQPAVRFLTDSPATPEQEHITSSIRNSVNNLMQGESLTKSVKPVTIRQEYKDKYVKSKVVYSNKDSMTSATGVEEKGWMRISDYELKNIVQVDPYIAAIITTRSAQGAVIGRATDSKFDKGTRVIETNPLKYDEFKDKAEFKLAQKEREIKMRSILNWFLTCGTTNKDVLNSVYLGEERTWQYCSLSEFVAAQIRNLLTFGRMATYKLRDENGMIVAFRPIPVETIKMVQEGSDIHLSQGGNSAGDSYKDSLEYNAIPEILKPIIYVQQINGQNYNTYTEEELSLNYYQKQALFDLNGYPLSPIEQAAYMVYTHFKTLEYMRNYFVKGIGTKSMLVIKTIDPSVQLSEEDLDSIRMQYHNFVSRNDNSATTPILSGPIDVEVIPLASNPKDMEFLQVEEHVIRALCSAMQISPQEMGYGHLSQGQGGLNQSSKQEEIIRGEERGLRMVLDTIFDCLNDILFEHFPEAETEFRLSYTGVGEDTRDTVVQRSNAELQTTATMSSLFADSEKNQIIQFGGDVPLSSVFHQNVVRYMKYGEVREYFFGDVGASEKPEYDFIVDPNLNQNYITLKINPIQAQQEQTKLQLQGMEQQQEQAQMQMQGQEQQMQMQQQQAEQGQLPQAPEQGQGQQEEAPEEETKDEGNQEDAEKSESLADALGNKDEALEKEFKGKALGDVLMEKEKLHKSMNMYFKSWLSSNN